MTLQIFSVTGSKKFQYSHFRVVSSALKNPPELRFKSPYLGAYLDVDVVIFFSNRRHVDFWTLTLLVLFKKNSFAMVYRRDLIHRTCNFPCTCKRKRSSIMALRFHGTFSLFRLLQLYQISESNQWDNNYLQDQKLTVGILSSKL